MALAYVNAKELIMAYIRDNGLRSGDRLPTENDFAGILGIGRLSLREGLNALKNEGVILSVQGSGTFVGSVSDDIFDTLNYHTSVTQMIENSGRRSGVSDFRKSIVKADKQVAEALRIEEGSEVPLCSRVRTADGVPVVITLDYLAPQLATPFMAFTEKDSSLYNFLEKDPGITIGPCITEIHPVQADEYSASVFQMEPGRPLLMLHNIVEDKYGTPIIFAIEYFKEKQFHFLITRGRA